MIQYLWYGLVMGGLVCLTALGLSLVYGAMKFPFFAYGDFVTLGAYVTYSFNLTLGWGFSISIIPSILITSSVGVTTYWLIFRRLRGKEIPSIIASFGLAFLLRNLIRFIWGSYFRRYNVKLPPATTFLGLRYAPHEVMFIATSVAVMLLLHFILKYTKEGKAIRALADNFDLAKLSGINVEHVTIYTWILASVYASIAGSLLGLQVAITPDLGWFYVFIPAWAAATFGGMGSAYGAIIGSYFISILTETSVIYLPAVYKQALSFIVLSLIVLLKPEGILG